jgi:hypothetical protein
VTISWKTMLGAVLVLILGTAAYKVGYASPRDARVKKLQAAKSDNASYEAWLARRTQVNKGLESVAATTLGASSDEVEARFRSGLNSIAAACGLANIAVNSTKPEPVFNPGGKTRGLSETGLKSALAKQVDFSVMRGDVSGVGSLPQVLRAIAAVKAQPWAHRIESFSIRPEGKERERFSLKLNVATIILPPALAPKTESKDVPVLALAEGAESAWARFVAKNIFREPPPAPATPQPAVAAAPAAPAPARPAFEDWKLTGVVQSRLGIEAFLVNVKTNQHLSLPTGSAVSEAKFVEGEGERAVFEIGGEKFEISNGQTLEQRRPVTR